MLNTEAKIISACLKGNRDAQRKLYEEHRAMLFAVCLRYADNRNDAEDMFQEGFIKIYRDLKQYKPIAPIGAWMRKVMVNTALEHLRKHKKYSSREVDNILLFEPNKDADVEDNLSAADLLKKIGSLPEEYRTVFNLFAIEGYAHVEISEMLNISVANSKVRLNRARNALKLTVEKELKFNSR